MERAEGEVSCEEGRGRGVLWRGQRGRCLVKRAEGEVSCEEGRGGGVL